MAVVLLAVAGAIVLVGVVAGLELFGANTSPLDTERTEQWFVRHAPRPIRHVLQRADKRFAGGALVAVVFVMLLLASVAVGWILDTVDENRGFARWDESAAKWGSAHATTSTTRLLEFATQFGATGWLLIVLGIIGLIRWQIDRRPSALAYLAVVGLGVSALNNGLKHLVDRERPNVMQLTGFGGSSFPSGHTAAAAACWAALALVAARRRSRALRTVAAAVAMCITVAVASSRVLLGVHWLTDVIAGVVVGWTWFLLVTVLFGGRLLRFGEPVERIKRTAGVEDELAPSGGAAEPIALN